MKGSNVPHKTAASLLLAFAVLMGATSCSASDVKQSKFESELRSKTQLDEKQAKCVTDKVYAQFKQNDINDLYTADDPKSLNAGVEAKFTKMITDCVT